ncbi:serine/threonine-protein kinase [Streptomyces sp. NPDC004610]|uniref:serine/threonine-protein kinase n=1 Tax=unclassified Streptomyces TaxID=2593676 RepID=UPI0033BD2422
MGEVFAARYELVDPIGRGGVGAVWRAWDHRRRRYVAAKVLQQSDAHSLLRFVREQALRIDHPHVLAPASWAADDDKVLFTMDLVAGGSLVHLVGDYGPLPPSFVCTLLDQLLSGLAAVHAEGVVHRDIKPANILLEATGTGRPRLRLSDFGISMRFGEPRLTETNLVVGTPGYLAPEQMMGAEPDFPADLFAVGLVALYLLEGAKPDAKALIQYFAEHGTPGAPQGIPEPLWQVVATLLQPDPETRFRTATGARKALASAVELLPEPGPDDEQIEIFDQLGPLPNGFAAEGPLKLASGVDPGTGTGTGTGTGRAGAGSGPEAGAGVGVGAGTGSSAAFGVGGGSGSLGVWPGTGSVSVDPRTNSTGTGSGALSGAAATGTGGMDPRQGTASPPPAADPHAPHPQAPAPHTTDPHAPAPHPSLAPPISMSDTGSFHLPPPQSTTSSPLRAQAPAQSPHQPLPPAHPATPPHLPPPPRHQPHPQPQPPSPSPSLTQPQSQSQPQIQPLHASAPHPLESTHALTPRPRIEASTASYTAQDPQVPTPAQAIPRHRADRRRKSRTGPPAKVAIPVLLLALACYVVGFWALAQI